MKKIFLDCTFLRNTHTGIDVAFLSLIHFILKVDKINSYIILVDSRYDQEYLRKQVGQASNCKFKTIFSPLPLQVLYSSFLIPFYLRLKKIDVYHNPYFFGPFFKIIAPKTKIVITVHDLYHHTIPQNRRVVINSIFRIFADRAIKRADKIIAISSQTLHDIMKYLNPKEENVVLIHQALSEKLVGKAPLISEIGKFKLSKGKYILTVGSLIPNKAFDDLLKAYDLLNKKYGVNDLKLVSVGAQQGDFAEGIKKLIKKMNYVSDEVQLLGYVDDEILKSLYADAFVFVLPSHYEGFGMPILEGMNFGIPVVARNSSSLVEVVGNSGMLFDDVDDLALKLLQLHNDDALYSQFVEKGYQRIKDFSWDATAKKTLTVYFN